MHLHEHTPYSSRFNVEQFQSILHSYSTSFLKISATRQDTKALEHQYCTLCQSCCSPLGGSKSTCILEVLRSQSFNADKITTSTQVSTFRSPHRFHPPWYGSMKVISNKQTKYTRFRYRKGTTGP